MGQLCGSLGIWPSSFSARWCVAAGSLLAFCADGLLTVPKTQKCCVEPPLPPFCFFFFCPFAKTPHSSPRMMFGARESRVNVGLPHSHTCVTVSPPGGNLTPAKCGWPFSRGSLTPCCCQRLLYCFLCAAVDTPLHQNHPSAHLFKHLKLIRCGHRITAPVGGWWTD